MKAIVECAGGKVLAKQPSFRKLMEHKQNKVRGQSPTKPVLSRVGTSPSLISPLSLSLP